MYITTTGFKKLIKEAYKLGSLRLANDGTGIILAGPYWAMWLREKHIPKKALASIIELTGVLPERGEIFQATKDGNQMEMEETRPIIYEIKENASRTDREMADTKLILETDGGPYHLLQDEVGGEILGIKEWIYAAIDTNAMEKEELAPAGPAKGPYGGIYYTNGIMAFMVLPMMNNTALIRYLERINIEQYKDGADVPETEDEEETEETQSEHPAE